jgi:DNA end-binding protein Ku
MLHRTCGTRVKMQLYCPFDKEVVQRRDTVKGYEHQKDQFVRFEDDELRRLEAEKTDRLEIVEFVPLDAVDWIYLADSHYLGPARGGDRAYALLSASMGRMKRLALGRYYTHGKTQLVVLRAHQGGLTMHQVHYAADVRSMDEVERPGQLDFKPVEQELADRLIEQLSVPTFRPDQYHDDYRDRVLAAVEQKVAGREVTTSPAEPQAQVIDLFEALKQSLAGNKNKNQKPANESAPPAPDPADDNGPPTERTPVAPVDAQAPPLAKGKERRSSGRKKQATS